MFDILRREDADGDNNMIGSGRRPALGFMAKAGLLAIVEVGVFRELKTVAIFRTCEKS